MRGRTRWGCRAGADLPGDTELPVGLPAPGLPLPQVPPAGPLGLSPASQNQAMDTGSIIPACPAARPAALTGDLPPLQGEPGPPLRAAVRGQHGGCRLAGSQAPHLWGQRSPSDRWVSPGREGETAEQKQASKAQSSSGSGRGPGVSLQPSPVLLSYDSLGGGRRGGGGREARDPQCPSVTGDARR